MPPRKILAHAFLLAYLTVTSAAFLFTMARVRVPLIPKRLMIFSYGMMAPYQGYLIFNNDLIAEGQLPGGTWEPIDLGPYHPMIRGNQVMYRRLRSFQADGAAVQGEKYREFARLLREREERRGRVYAAVRVSWIDWPVSPKGFEALRREPLITRHFITQVP